MPEGRSGASVRDRAMIRGLEAMLDDVVSGLLRIVNEAISLNEAQEAAREALRDIGEAVDE